jgi:hypothetical protein
LVLAGVVVGEELVVLAWVVVEAKRGQVSPELVPSSSRVLRANLQLRLLLELELEVLEDVVVVVELVEVVVETLVLVEEPDVTVDELTETEALAVPWKFHCTL